VQATRATLLERFYARDTIHDGTFVVGVVTTGIYCLPSCSAKKPKPENVRFFDSEDGAKQFGLRACKRCRPDRFYQNYDPDLETLRELAQRVRRAPAEFADAHALARAAGFGITKLGKLFHEHFHTTPATFLQRTRVAFACTALAKPNARTVDVALDAGFESSSAFHDNFRRWTALTPGAYKRLGTTDAFTLALPPNYTPHDLFGLFGRSSKQLCERTSGKQATKIMTVDGEALRVDLTFTRTRVRCETRRDLQRAVHAKVFRMLGLGSDPDGFERRIARDRKLAKFIARRPGLRIPQLADPFEALVWVVVGQQINLAFAALCRDRLIEHCGEPLADGFFAHPTPERVAQLEYDELVPLQFSRRKAEYLIDTARLVANGELDLEGLRDATAGDVTSTLNAVRGFGPWSVQYLMLRAYGFGDCVPVGDSGLATALERYFELPARPDRKETLELMQPFAPYRSLASFHFWKSLEETT